MFSFYMSTVSQARAPKLKTSFLRELIIKFQFFESH